MANITQFMPVGRPFATEAEAVRYVRSQFERREFSFIEEVWTGSGRIDMVLLGEGGEPTLGIELKRDIHDQTSASALADYMEQAVAYSRDMNIPVLLGPAMSDLEGMSLHLGGTSPRSLCSLAIFGGRVNVGVLAFSRDHRITMVLRGQVGYQERKYRDEIVSRSDVFRMVTSKNSEKRRA